MMRTQHGMVLISTLLVLWILTLLLLGCLQDLVLQGHLLQSFKDQDVTLARLESIADQQIQRWRAMDNQACWVHDLSANDVLQRVSVEGCRVQQARYWVDDLGLFPCILVKKHGVLLSTRQAIITVVTQTIPPHWLQIRVAMASTLNTCLHYDSFLRSEGIMSWRWV